MLKPKNVIDREDKGEIVEAEGGGTMTKVYCTAIVLAAGAEREWEQKFISNICSCVKSRYLRIPCRHSNNPTL